MAFMGHVIKIVASNELPTKVCISSVNKYLCLHTSRKVRWRHVPTQDLLYNTLRMECITAHKGCGINLLFMKIHFMLKPE